LLSNQLNQFVVDFGAVWIEEGTSGGQLMIVKKFLGAANSSMIAFLGFFLKMNVFVELFFAWERNAVNTLQVVVLSIAEPVSR